MTEPRSPRTAGQKLKSLEGIFGIVLLSISILGLIFTLVLPWYSYEITMEYDTDTIPGMDEEISGQSVKITETESYTYDELEEKTVGNYLENGATYVLVGFIILLLFSLIFLVGLFSEFIRLPASMLVFGTRQEEGLAARHLNSLNSIAALLMWFPVTLILYGSSRFVGVERMSETNIVNIYEIQGYLNISVSHSTVCGYLLFFLGLSMLGGLVYYLYRTWLKSVVLTITSSSGREYVKKGSIIMIVGVLLLTLGLASMPIFSMAKEEITMGEENYEFFHTDGIFHNNLDYMEESGRIDKNWEDVADDLSLMQWTLFSGIILSLLVLIGFSINLANPKYTIAPLLQLCVLLVVIAGIIFMIGQIMLWTDIGDLSSGVSTEFWTQEFSFGWNYFPFIFSLLALGCAGYASAVTVPNTFKMFKGVEYGEVASTAAGFPAISTDSSVGDSSGGAPRRTPVYSGFSRGFKAKKKPIIVSLGIVAVIVAGILVYVFVIPSGDSGDEVKADENVVFNPDDYGYGTSHPSIINGYAEEGGDNGFGHDITEEMVAGANFRLTWTDEDEVGWIGSTPNRENEPDTFTMIVTSPGGNVTEEGTAMNEYKEEGVIEFYVTIPEENISDSEGTGMWQIVLQVDAGDHVPKYAGGLLFVDSGNEFNLEIIYNYYAEKDAPQE